MQTLDKLVVGKHLKLMAYGPSGTGKTCFAASFPGPMLYLDFANKIESAAAYYAKDPEFLKKIKFQKFGPGATNGADPVDLFNKLLAGLQQSASDGKFPFKTVVLDSFTTFSKVLMSKILKDNPGIKRVNPATPTMMDYGIFNNSFQPSLQRLLALPCNVVCVGHVKTSQDEVTGEMVRQPLLSGQNADMVPILFDEVYKTFTEDKDGKVFYLARTAGPGAVTRTQIPGMPQVIHLGYKFIKEQLK